MRECRCLQWSTSRVDSHWWVFPNWWNVLFIHYICSKQRFGLDESLINEDPNMMFTLLRNIFSRYVRNSQFTLCYFCIDQVTRLSVLGPMIGPQPDLQPIMPTASLMFLRRRVVDQGSSGFAILGVKGRKCQSFIEFSAKKWPILNPFQEFWFKLTIVLKLIHWAELCLLSLSNIKFQHWIFYELVEDLCFMYFLNTVPKFSFS